jgi:hypothetical protein
MSLTSDFSEANELDDRLGRAPALTIGLLSDVIRSICPRFSQLRRIHRTARTEQLIEQGAWTDAALALLAVELPQWQLRRLAYDNGEWHCALSSQREMPERLDQSIEARHADLPMAILRAFISARQQGAADTRPSVPEVPHVNGELYEPVCCDHFG